MAKGDRIQLTSFNNLQSIVSSVMGTNPNGYGQFLNSTPASSGSLISSTQWNNLRTDLARAYSHQTNNDISNTLATVNANPPNLQLITGNTVFSSAILTQYTNFANFISTNRGIANANQMTPNIAITSTQRTANWGGAIDVISHTVTLTFGGYTQNNGTLVVPAGDHATYFFNAGGYIQISASFVPSSTPAAGTKNKMWQDLLSQFNQIHFKKSSTQALLPGNINTATSTETNNTATSDNTLPGVASSIGFNSLTIGDTTYTQIFRTTGPASPAFPNNSYVENDYIIKVRRPTASTLEFVITFRDDDAGDQTGIDPAIDEEVTGTLTSLVRCTRPSGSNGKVDVPAPTGTSTVL